MSETIRPRRSVLYMPGFNARALEKAKTLPADALILDLEDAVSPDSKDVARDQVCQAVKEGGYGKRELIIRINAMDTEWWKADLEAACKAGPDAVLVPKINDAGMVQEIERLMDEFGASERTKIWSMMETPMGILNAQSIAQASERQAAWVMGTNDIAKEVGCAQTLDRQPMITALSLCLLAARAYGLAILDGVHNDFKNEEAFDSVSQQGREFGFDGKTLIHPVQVEPCNRIFSPSEKEIEDAKAVIEGFKQAKAEGKGVVTVNGRMIEELHVEIAKKTVAIAEAIAEMAAA